MSPVQIFLIALFIYLGSIGSIVGNTIGWYTLGRPLVAAFVVGLIMGDVPTAMAIGIPLQIMYMGNVTPGGAGARGSPRGAAPGKHSCHKKYD